MLGGVTDIARLLSQGRFDLSTETKCQADIETLLLASLPAGVVSREHRLSPADRPDFLVFDSIVIEVKVKGAGRAAIERQLLRYAVHPQVTGLVLATGVAMSLPDRLYGKPLAVVSMGRAWL